MRRSRTRRRYDEYDYDDYYRRRPSALLRFFIGVIWVLGSVVAFCVLVLIAFNFAIFLQILFYALWIGAGLAILGIIYLAIRLISAMSLRLSQARLAKANAEQERMKALQEQERIQAMRAKRERDQQLFLHRQTRQLEAPLPSPYKTRQLSPPPEEEEPVQIQARALPAPASIQERPEERENRPVFLYADIGCFAHPGQLLIGVRQDGTIRVGTWQDYKILLVLGSSSSGKTTTILEKVLGAARGGGLLVICDPHGYKQDSLLRRVDPLSGCLLSGTCFAISHDDIMRNVQSVKRELERRVAGGSCAVPIFLIVEELNRLQRDKAIAEHLKEILQTIGQEGRGFNVYAIIGAQQITHLAEIRKSIISFIIHRVDETEARLCIPARFAKFASELGVGQTFVKDADGITEMLQQVLVTVEDVERVAAALQRARQQQTRALAQPPAPKQQAKQQGVAEPQDDRFVEPAMEHFPRHRTRLVRSSAPIPHRTTEPIPPPQERQPSRGSKSEQKQEPGLTRPMPAQRDTEDLSRSSSLRQAPRDQLEILAELRARKHTKRRSPGI